MTVQPDTSGWTALAETANSQNFEVEPHVYAAVPRPGSRDNGESARANIAAQRAHLEPRGGGVVIIFFDNLVEQNKEARQVYQAGADPSWMRGTALVGGTMLSRAIGSFFLGLSRPRTPLKMFDSFAAALAWARERNRDLAKETP